MRQPSSQPRFTEPGSINIPVGRIPRADLIKPENPSHIAQEVVEKLNQALHVQDIRNISAWFYEDGYWRDHLALSWDLRTLKGPNAIRAMLEKGCQLTEMKLDISSEFRAPRLEIRGDLTTVQFFFTFTTKVGTGRGIARLVPVNSEWKIWTMYTSLQELNGHEEPAGARRTVGPEQLTPGKNWQELRREEVAFENRDPIVLIIGAGQAGLTLSARLKMLKLSSLCIDTNTTVGDNWRARYHNLVLHDSVWYDHLPYVPFPDSWPIFTAKDKLADFFEAYAKILELNIWMQTQVKQSTWDASKKQWTVTLETIAADGSRTIRVVRPFHVVQATGHSGQKQMPNVPGMDRYEGELLHSSDFKGAQKGNEGKKAVVIGACNSAHDICHDLWNKGYDVTMIQRSSTLVVTPRTIGQTLLGGLYVEGGPPVEDADLMTWSVPSELSKAFGKMASRVSKKLDAPILEGLAKAGFRLNSGPDDAGFFMDYLQRGGGYYIDVGTSQLIVDGRIKVISGRGVRDILPRAIRLLDGTEVPADMIVFATGYQNMRSQTRQIFGEGLADQVDDVWGFDSEGEVRSMWRRTKHPGFWYMGGNLALCRYFSRMLALQIKAVQEGLI
ncbi:hypothetical protein GX51_06460 [Blastomyces parvus]|uniref:FAD/NAD(P)-binding domain-containing protein n=1 Tax=Blastomyces parvus TaxID=2060905 RepID=A0A2B7WQX1_9EURO|nr:hypothetical protein GX51_06460 [Blastomyces parvus]